MESYYRYLSLQFYKKNLPSECVTATWTVCFGIKCSESKSFLLLRWLRRWLFSPIHPVESTGFKCKTSRQKRGSALYWHADTRSKINAAICFIIQGRSERFCCCVWSVSAFTVSIDLPARHRIKRGKKEEKNPWIKWKEEEKRINSTQKVCSGSLNRPSQSRTMVSPHFHIYPLLSDSV